MVGEDGFGGRARVLFLVTSAAFLAGCGARRDASVGESPTAEAKLLSYRQLEILFDASWELSPEEIGVSGDLIERSMARLSCAQLLSLLGTLPTYTLDDLKLHMMLSKRMAASPDDELLREMMKLATDCSGWYDSDLWLTMGRMARARRSEGFERLRFLLLVAGRLDWDYKPESARERRALFDKFSCIPLEEMAGKDRADAVREMCARKWVSSFSFDDLAAHVLAYAANAALKEQWVAECEKGMSGPIGAIRSYALQNLCGALALTMKEEAMPLFEKWLARRKELDGSLRFGYEICLGALARVPGERSLKLLEEEISGTGDYYAARPALAAIAARPEGDGLAALRRLHASADNEQRQFLLLALACARLEGCDERAKEFFAAVAREGLKTEGHMAPLTVFHGDAEEVGNAQALRHAAYVFAGLGPEYEDDLLSLLRGISPDRMSLVDAGIDTPPLYAEESIIRLSARECGKRAEGEFVRLLEHKEASARYWALRALAATESTAHLDEATRLLDDPSMMVRVEAATHLARIGLSSRKVTEILAGVLSTKHEFTAWLGGAAWGECDIEQFGPAARAYHSLRPGEANKALRALLEWSRHKGERDSPSWTAWEYAYPLYVELAGKKDAIPWDYCDRSDLIRREYLPEMLGEEKHGGGALPVARMPAEYAELPGRELVRRLEDEGTQMFALYELTRRSEPEDWRWVNLAHFMRDHRCLGLVVCPQQGKPPLHAVLYQYSEGRDDSGGVGGSGGFPRMPEIWKKGPAVAAFNAEGRAIPMPNGNIVLNPGAMLDINGDGLVECVNHLPVRMDERISVDVLTVHVMNEEMRMLLSVAYNWGASLGWASDLFDEDRDGVLDVAVGQLGGKGLEPKAVYRWDAARKRYVGPEGGKGDSFCLLDPDDLWEALRRLEEAGGLPLR